MPNGILIVVLVVPDAGSIKLVSTEKDPLTTIVDYTALRTTNLCNVTDAVSEQSRSKHSSL